MRKILFITPGPITWASSRMRAHWVAEHLESDVIEGDKLSGVPDEYTDVIFVKVTNSKLVKSLQKHDIRVWWDICDPVHWFDPGAAAKMGGLVDGIVASNQGLADDFSEWISRPVKVIKDRLKLSHFFVKQTISTDKPLRFIWYGAYQNRFSLMAGFAYLERLSANGINVELTIFDDSPDIIWKYTNFPIYHVPWDLGLESQIISAHDIAVLPDYPGPWGLVKSNNRHVTAHACGVVPTKADDFEELYKLSTEPEYRLKLATKGLAWVQKEYDVRQSANEWLELMS